MKKSIIILTFIFNLLYNAQANINWDIYIDIRDATNLSNDREITDSNGTSIKLSEPNLILTEWNGTTAKNYPEETEINALEGINLEMGNTIGMLLPLTTTSTIPIFQVFLIAIPNNCEELEVGNRPVQCGLAAKLLDQIIVSGQALRVNTGDCKDGNRGLVNEPITVDSSVIEFDPYRIQMLFLSSNDSNYTLADKNEEMQNIQKPEYYWENLASNNNNVYTHPQFKFDSITNIEGNTYSINENEITNVNISLYDFINTNITPLKYKTYVNSFQEKSIGAREWMNLETTELYRVSEVNLELHPTPIIETSYKINSISSEQQDIITFLENNEQPFNDASDLPGEAIFTFSNLYPVNTTGVNLIYPNGSTKKFFLDNNSENGTISITLNTLAIMPGSYTLKIEYIIPFGNTLSSSLDYNSNPEFNVCSSNKESLSVTFTIGNNSNGTINIQ